MHPKYKVFYIDVTVVTWLISCSERSLDGAMIAWIRTVVRIANWVVVQFAIFVGAVHI